MTTVVLGPRPAEIDELIARRQRLGQDLFDEVWEGVYHMAPAPNVAHSLLDQRVAVVLEPLARAAGLVGSGPFNLGRPGNFRVPARGLHRGTPAGVWIATAAVVVEILSPDDETFAKFGFYAAQEVDELLGVDPVARQVRLWQRAGEAYDETGRSEVLGVTAAGVTSAIEWPTPRE